MKSLYQNFFKQVDNQVILYFDDSSVYTAKDLKEKILAIYNVVIQNTLLSNFAICTSNPFLFTASFFALIYAKKTPVVLGHAKKKLLDEQKYLFDAILSDVPIEIDSVVFNVSGISSKLEKSVYGDLFEQNISDRIAILMTSGSSSEPKKIIKSIQYLEAETMLLMDKWKQELQGTVFLSTVSPLHQYGLTFNILLPLVSKAKIYNNQLFYQEELARFDEFTSYVLITSPAFLKRLDETLKFNLDFNLIFSAGGALGVNAVESCNEVLKKWPIEIYGSSESGVIAFNQHTEVINAEFSPFLDVLIQQYEDETIKVSSPLFEKNSGFRLNDRIAINDNGTFCILGRTDKIVKIEEKKISLTEIESRIKNLSNIDHIYVFVLPNGSRDIIGCVIVNDIDKSEEKSIISFLSRELKQYIEPIAVPKRWRFIREVPMNSQGKVSLFELRELFND